MNTSSTFNFRWRSWLGMSVALLLFYGVTNVLAAIIVPQFSSATVDAQESALDANLTGLRSAIELYRAQHGTLYPGAVATTGGTCTAM